MSIRSALKKWDWLRNLNSYRKYVKYVRKHYKSETSHSCVATMRAVVNAQARHISTKEFCFFHYMDLTRDEQGRIVPWAEQASFYSKANTEEAGVLLCNKFSTYERVKEYYRREVFSVPAEKAGSVEDFCNFARRNGKIVIKPIDANRGFGVRLINTSEMSDSDLVLLLNDYPDGAVAEGLIVQSEALGAFHPQSVNTVRINTIRYDDGVEVKWPCLRTGRGNSIVDNAGAGGIFVAIDEHTGVALGAADEKGNSYTHHPDSGLPLVDFVIPDWDKACTMAKRLAEMLPENRFTGWDFALTDQGWLLVEGNYMPLIIWQIAARKGIRPEFEAMRSRVMDNVKKSRK